MTKQVKSSDKYVRRAPGVYRKGDRLYRRAGNRYVPLPKDTKVVNGDKDKGSGVARGKEASISEPAGTGQILYGKARIGGTYTFVETSADSKAELVTQQDTKAELLWVAREAYKGAAGNEISIEVLASANGTTTVSVADKKITVTLKNNGDTALNVRDKVRASTAASALITIALNGRDNDGSVKVTPFSQTELSGGGGTHLHQFITLTCHEIDAIEALYFDNRQVTFNRIINGATDRWASGLWDHKAFMAIQYGGTDQPAQADLVAQRPSWTTNHRQRGFSGVYLITVYNARTYPNGLPEIDFLVRGKRLYNPISGTTAYSNNAALVIADFLTTPRSQGGCGVSWSDIDLTSLGDAINVCNESVLLNDGVTSVPRYVINGLISTSTSRMSTLEDMARAIAGDIVRQNGKWHVYPGKWRAPVKTLTEKNLRGPVKISTAISRKDLYNGVRGTHVSSLKNWEETDYPTVRDAGYLAADNNKENLLDYPQPLLSGDNQMSAQCQRVGRIALHKSRQGMEVSAVFDVSCVPLQVCDVVTLQLERYGINGTYEVRDYTFKIDVEAGLVVELILRETAELVYTWTSNETTFDLAPNTTLPMPGDLATPSGLSLTSGTSELYRQSDGTVVTRIKAAWNQTTDIFVYEDGSYEIQYKKHSDSSWLTALSVSGDATYAYITDVEDKETYDVRIRSKNAIGAVSDWATVSEHLVAGKTTPPTPVTQGSVGSSVDRYGITLSWAEIEDVDRGVYEVREGASWDDPSVVVLGRIKGTVFNTGVRLAGEHKFFIRSVDTTGNVATSDATATVTVDGPGQPSVDQVVQNDEVVLSWSPVSSDFQVLRYRITYGDEFVGSTFAAEVAGCTYRQRINWSGARKWWVQAFDEAGNSSTEGSAISTIIQAPAVSGLWSQVVDNNVLLRWNASTGGTLPIASYRVVKGPSVSDVSSVVIGDVAGTFATVFEVISGSYTYWVTPYDSAGNPGVSTSTTATVSEPPDFIFHDQVVLDPSAALTRTNVALVDATSIAAPVPSETYGVHFSSRSWSSPNDQITGVGFSPLTFPKYIQPATLTPGVFEQVWDTGATIDSGTMVTLDYLSEAVAGTVTVTPRISYSADGISYTDGPDGSRQIFASGFQYVKVRITFEADDLTSIVILKNLSLTLNVKRKRESGFDFISAAGGKTVDFTQTFIDVDSLNVSGPFDSYYNYPMTFLYEFADNPNPTSFKVRVFKTLDGTEITPAVGHPIKFSWQVTGV